MPEISRFMNIVITMYHRDHGPPHFHARYSGSTISVDIRSGRIEGQFPRRQLRAVREWHEIHLDELMENWHLVSERKPIKKIAPLE